MADSNDGNPGDAGQTPTAPAPTAPPAPPAPAPTNDVITMTNAEFNAKLANHKRGLQSELATTRQKATAFDALQSQVSEALESGLFEGVESLAEFQDAAANTINELRSDRERFEAAQKTNEKALTAAQQAAQQATEKFNKSTIMQDLAINAPIGTKVVSAGALELIQMKLSSVAEVQPDDSVLYTLNVADEDGKITPQKLTGEQAIAAMEADVTKYGTLFVATVNQGAGTEIIDGVKRTATGAFDLAEMSMEKFMEMEDKQPGAVAASLSR